MNHDRKKVSSFNADPSGLLCAFAPFYWECIAARREQADQIISEKKKQLEDAGMASNFSSAAGHVIGTEVGKGLKGIMYAGLLIGGAYIGWLYLSKKAISSFTEK